MIFRELHLLDDPEPYSAALNMAIDEVLLREAEAPLLRCYRWERPAVSFGYFGRVAEVEAAWPGRDLVRRWTGGGIVPHGEDFTYTLIVPHGDVVAALSPAESYRVIHEQIGRVLDAPTLALAGAAQRKVSDACFENPVRYDLVSGSQKVAGAAQRRTRHGLLHQGSIQLALAPAFSEKLAASLAKEIRLQPLSATTEVAALELAIVRYATPEWLRRM